MRLTLFLIIIVSATLIFCSDSCLVSSSNQFLKGPRGQPHNLIAPTSQDAEQALIILSTEDKASMKECLDYICAKGGRVTHVYPTHIFIGNVPRAISQQLVGQKGIEGIYYSIVDSSQVKKYGDMAVFAVEAWNNNFMGQANLKGLTPDPDAPEPAPIRADVEIHPSPDESKSLQVASAPYGAGYYDTSEYMIGKISVAIILPESNGAIDPNQENWASSDISNVVSEIQAGLNWWAAREWKANLQFVYTGYVVGTSYEPISRTACGPSTDEGLWIGEVMYNLGYTSGNYFDRVYAYLNDLRNSDRTDWAFAIFVAQSWWDLDGCFSNGKFAYAYLGGPFLVMTYDNDGYSISNMDAVNAHETGHIFYALDEYYDAQVPPTARSGYLNVENQNTEYGGSSNVPCIMRGQVSPYTQGALCDYTRGQVGWRDSNSNGVMDILDFYPENTITSSPPSPTFDTTPDFAGQANSRQVYPNSNPHGYGNDITVNIIVNVVYYVDDAQSNQIRGPINANPSDGSFDSSLESWSFTADQLSSGTYRFRIVAWNSVGKGYVNSIWVTISGCYLTVDTDPSGLDSPSGSGSYSCGSVVPVSVSPVSGYTFNFWYIDGNPNAIYSYDMTTSIMVNRDLRLTAKFTIPADQGALLVFRPSVGTWYYTTKFNSYNDYNCKQWGISGDRPLLGDFDGDGKADLVVYRPSQGSWYWTTSSSSYLDYHLKSWGLANDIPLLGDFDGDGKSDLAVFRPSTGCCHWTTSGSGYSDYNTKPWGLSGDVPLLADMDGDGKADLVVYRPSTGTWWWTTSSSGYSDYNIKQWGLKDDKPLVCDVDGDGKADLTVFRPNNGYWYYTTSSSGYSDYNVKPWGLPGDVPLVGDLDGDSKSDLVVFRVSSGCWYYTTSSSGYTSYNMKQWGMKGDIPVLFNAKFCVPTWL